MQEAKSRNLDDQASTDFLVRELAETFPEFRDTHTFTSERAKGEEVYLFKRIFFLLHSLHLKFADREDWAVPNTFNTLPMFVDNVLPTLCVWFNFFDTPSSSSSAADEEMKTLYDWVRSAHCNADLPRTKLASLEKNVAGPKLTKDETYAIGRRVERCKVVATGEGVSTEGGGAEVVRGAQ